MKKKILVISNLYPSTEDPVFGVFVKNFVTSLTACPETEVSTVLIKGRSYNSFTRVRKYIRFYLAILYKLLFFKYDLVYVHLITHSAPPIRFVSYFRSLPLAFNIHGEDLLTQTRLAAFFLQTVKPLLKKAKLIVVPSVFFKNKTLELLPFLDPGQIYVSASGGVNPALFYPRQVNKPVPTIGYVSRIDRGKGWNVLLKTTALLKKEGFFPKVIFAGGGEETENFLQLKNELQLDNVEYLGPLSQEQLPSVYSQMHLFIFPTLLEESLGLVALEAMACGCPVIGSGIGGLTDYIQEDYNGYLFTAGDEYELADKITHYFSLPAEQKKDLSQNAISTAEKYYTHNVSAKMNQKIIDILNTD